MQLLTRRRREREREEKDTEYGVQRTCTDPYTVVHSPYRPSAGTVRLGDYRIVIINTKQNTE